ncbi:nucleoside-diphosphate-sugar pyrophosphorylase [uncultured archaeon]|nr:nucleoside-diphosphate-sugar pyrophosphorylase [uncultured archaeon]
MALKAVIMAGGKGTRLRPITYSIPKPLVPIAGKPCIDYSINSYYNAGVKNVIITTGYKFESLIMGVLEFKNEDQNILFSVEKEPAGTAGSVKLVREFVDDTVIIGSGDTLVDFDISDMLRFHKEKKSKLTIGLTTVDDPSQFGIVELKNDLVVRFLEKPSKDETFSNLINAGVYIMEPEVIDHIPSGIQYDFAKQLFPKLLKESEKIYGYVGSGTWLDTGRPNDMIRANQIMTEKYGTEMNSENTKGKVIIKSRRIGTGNSDTVIEGPTYIGENVSIGKNAVIKRSAIYDGVTIGDDVEITDSILMDSSRVKDKTNIDRSVIMRQTTIGENCEIHESVLSPRLNLQSNSRVYQVSLSSEIIQEENQ